MSSGNHPSGLNAEQYKRQKHTIVLYIPAEEWEEFRKAISDTRREA